MGYDFGGLKKELMQLFIFVGGLSGISIFAGYVWGDAYFGLVGLWMILLGIFTCLLVIVYASALQTDSVREQLMKLNEEVVRWRESQKPGKKK
jgi:hypothetical protein